MEPPALTWRGRAAWGALLGLLLLRALATLLPSMWAWGVDVQRFLAPALAWLPWLACALLLIRPAGEALAPALDRVGAGLVRGGGWVWLAAAAVALLAWMLPDRSWLIGDFRLLSTFRGAPGPELTA